jgi:hypothetical protein
MDNGAVTAYAKTRIVVPVPDRTHLTLMAARVTC